MKISRIVDIVLRIACSNDEETALEDRYLWDVEGKKDLLARQEAVLAEMLAEDGWDSAEVVDMEVL